MLWMRAFHAAGIHSFASGVPWLRFFGWYLLISVIYVALFIGALYYIDFFDMGSTLEVVFLWFPAAGVSLVYLLWVGPLGFLFVWCAELLNNFIIIPIPFPSGAVVLFTLFKTLFYMGEATLLLCIDPAVPIQHPLYILRFVLITLVCHFCISSTFVAFLVILYNETTADEYWKTLSTWVLGDLSGILTVTFIVLLLRKLFRGFFSATPERRATLLANLSRKRVEICLKLALVIALAGVSLWLTFWPSSEAGPRIYLILAPLLACSFFFGVLGVVILMLLQEIISVAVVYYRPSLLAALSPLGYQFAIFVFDLFALFLSAEHETRERSEQAQKRGDQRNQLLEVVAHDIKTPLHGISGMLDLLFESANIDRRDRKYVVTARHACLVLSSIVGDVLSLRRLEATGHLPILPTLFSNRDLCRVIDDEADLFYSTADDAGLMLQVYYSYQMWSNMQMENYADLMRLQQVLTNLLSNALKFTKQGHVSVELVDTDDGWFTVSVRDSGAGISQENLQKLFGRFTQLDEGKRKQGGTGLGLYISQSICGSMGGSLEVDSVVGKGTTFTVRFPRGGAFHGVVKDRRAQMIRSPSKISSENMQCRLGVVCTDTLFQSFLLRVVEEFPAVRLIRIMQLADEQPSLNNLDRLIIDVDCASRNDLQSVAPLLRDLPCLLLVNPETPSQNLGPSVVVTPKPLHPSHLYQLLTVDPNDFSFGFRVVSDPALDSGGLPKPPSFRKESTGIHEGSSTRSPRMVKLRVLVVDDVLMNRKVAERLLAKAYGEENLIITMASDGVEAAEIFSQHRGQFDVILMDIMMPVCDGFESLDLIRKKEKNLSRLKPVPIVALTAGAGDLLSRAEKKFNATLTKPFTYEKLTNTLKEIGIRPQE